MPLDLYLVVHVKRDEVQAVAPRAQRACAITASRALPAVSPPRPDKLRAETLAVRSARGACGSPISLSFRDGVSSTVWPAEINVSKVTRGQAAALRAFPFAPSAASW